MPVGQTGSKGRGRTANPGPFLLSRGETLAGFAVASARRKFKPRPLPDDLAPTRALKVRS